MVESVQKSPFYQAQEKIEKWLYGKTLGPQLPKKLQRLHAPNKVPANSEPTRLRRLFSCEITLETLSFMEIMIQEVKLIS